ncbi:hypothetical protein LCGC14_1737890 [marine sediment metagenome]|uniref:TFIIB-type domain-containing protein n=1 Tax=marine sediment metagenome TaxID=412755 RepID=A0A0F9JMW0_9ZZZZ
MATGKGSISVNYLNLTCDLCNSNDIVETIQGYVCRACGVELTIQKLRYDRPYTEDAMQYARGLGKTQIGTKRERLTSPVSRSLKRLSWHNSKMGNEEAVIFRAEREISRIFEVLDLPRNVKSLVVDKFSKVRAHLQPRTRLRNPEKLSAILVYMVLKIENIAVLRSELVENSELTSEGFNRFFMQVRPFLPEYSGRDRIVSISQKLLEITEHFGLEMPFYFLAKKILHRLWDAVKNTTDNIVAGLCASITALCSYKGVINVSSICKLLGIKMSAIQFQVQTRIFKTFRIEGFKTLVRSSDLLERFMKKIGLIEGEDSEVNEALQEEPVSNIVQVQLGNAQQTFNPVDDHYIFEFIDDFGTVVYAYLEVHNQINTRKFSMQMQKDLGVLCDLTLGEYFPSKGPPMLAYT